jgi:hypothetical protein
MACIISIHSCDFPPCNNPSHLFQGSNADNINDMLLKGRSAKGEKQGGAKLNDKKIRKIRDFYARGASYAWIASRYGVKKSTIGRIIRGENLDSRHITTPLLPRDTHCSRAPS